MRSSVRAPVSSSCGRYRFLERGGLCRCSHLALSALSAKITTRAIIAIQAAIEAAEIDARAHGTLSPHSLSSSLAGAIGSIGPGRLESVSKVTKRVPDGARA